MTFRKTLHGEMKDATKSGVAQVSKMLEKEEIAETEEAILWDMALLGANVCFQKNIHTPTMEGIGNSGGVGGQRTWRFQSGGGVIGEICFQRVNFDLITSVLI